jgi:hypothetical protein
MSIRRVTALLIWIYFSSVGLALGQVTGQNSDPAPGESRLSEP